MNLRSSLQGRGDLGRRIMEHRERAGMSREEAAERAGQALSYLSYLEASPAPRPSTAALDQLATALGTTPAALLGVGHAAPPSRGRAAVGKDPAARAGASSPAPVIRSGHADIRARPRSISFHLFPRN